VEALATEQVPASGREKAVRTWNWPLTLIVLVKMDAYSWLAYDVIIFKNPKLKSHQSFYPHQALEWVN